MNDIVSGWFGLVWFSRNASKIYYNTYFSTHVFLLKFT